MKENNKSLWAGLAVVIATVVIILLVGILALKPQKELITGEADASEYRVSNMVPGHVDTLYVKEGDRVRRGDTLAHIASRQVDAKMLQAEAARSAASAQSRKAQAGARSQQKEMAYQVWQKAKAAEEVYRKSYERVKGSSMTRWRPSTRWPRPTAPPPSSSTSWRRRARSARTSTPPRPSWDAPEAPWPRCRAIWTTATS